MRWEIPQTHSGNIWIYQFILTDLSLRLSFHVNPIEKNPPHLQTIKFSMWPVLFEWMKTIFRSGLWSPEWARNSELLMTEQSQ